MSARFSLGQSVRVIDRDQPGHVRTPWYIRGKVGVICKQCGAFPNPENLAYGGLGLPYKRLYRVHFTQASVWPDYSGPDADSLEVEIYEHWLEPADVTTGAAA